MKSYLRQLLEGISYCHQNRVLHRYLVIQVFFADTDGLQGSETSKLVGEFQGRDQAGWLGWPGPSVFLWEVILTKWWPSGTGEVHGMMLLSKFLLKKSSWDSPWHQVLYRSCGHMELGLHFRRNGNHYRTRVRSLAMLVTHWLTNSLTDCRLGNLIDVVTVIDVDDEK